MTRRRLLRAVVCGVTCCALTGCGGTPAGPTRPPAAHETSPGPAGSSAGSSARSAGPVSARASIAGWRLAQPSARQALVDLGGGRVMLAGGMLPGDTSTNAVRRIDLRTGRSSQLAPLLVPVHDAAGGRFDGAPAVFGGGNATEQALVQAIRGASWRRVAAFPTTRSDLSVVSTPYGTVALGGYDGTSTPRTVFVQRPGQRLRPAGQLVRGVRYAATAYVAGAVYVFGGEVSGAELRTVQRVDPRTGSARVVATLPRPLGHAMAVGIGGRALILGGHVGAVARTDRMWWFDPATRRFTPAGRLPRPVSDAAVASDGTSVWLLGGEDPGVTDRVVRVDLRR